jgi:hypothetical protein
MKEIWKENSASESCDIKNLSEYLIKEQNKALRDSTTSIKEELKEERKAFRESIEANQRPGSESTARRIPQRRTHPEFNKRRDNRVARNIHQEVHRNKRPRTKGAVTFEGEENIRQAREEDCSSADGEGKPNSWFFHWTTRSGRLDLLESSTSSECKKEVIRQQDKYIEDTAALGKVNFKILINISISSYCFHIYCIVQIKSHGSKTNTCLINYFMILILIWEFVTALILWS